jgi:N-acetylmuramoyl-L-alanine amidase
VSIHVNSHPSPSVAGFETYYLDRTAALDAAKVVDRENGRQSRVQRVTLSGRVLESRRLAISVQRHSVSRVRSSGFAISGHGVKGAPFFVLSATSMPAILAEVGYCTNKAEADLLGRPAYRQAIAAGIAEGVMAYSSSRSGRITAENSGRQAIR